MDELKSSTINETNRPLILLVEDDATILKVHKQLLEKWGLRVDTAITGEEAITKFIKFQYPLVILDGGLPDMFGDELGKRMREHEKSAGRPRTPLILLSGYTEEKIKELCRLGDIDKFAQKPVHTIIFESLVFCYLNRPL